MASFSALEGLASLPRFTATVAAVLIAAIIWRLQTDPLKHIPGPLIARLTPVWYWWLTWTGTECQAIDALHQKYGRVVRLTPNDVDISDGTAIHTIYIKSGGYRKPADYGNFNVHDFETIFSVQHPVHRAPRAKAVTPMFAQQAITKGRPAVQEVIDELVSELKRRKTNAHGEPVDVLNLFRALAIGITSTYLLGETFDDVGAPILKATAFVDSFAAVGRFFHLPLWLFNIVHDSAHRVDRNKTTIDSSTNFVEEFAARVVDKSISKDEYQSYQGRLLATGISREEAIAQVIDIMFAGTDGAGTTLTHLCWHLSQHPDKYERAIEEIRENPDTDAQSLPYLSCIVKESLRLSMANPTRLPRLVPRGGMHIDGLPSLPAGARVGVGSYILHFNPDVFPRPREFVPERWLDPTQEMLRDSFSFGAGSRQCIARNLASAGLWWSAEAIIRSDVLRGATPVKDKIEFLEWFNARIRDGVVELQWS